MGEPHADGTATDWAAAARTRPRIGAQAQRPSSPVTHGRSASGLRALGARPAVRELERASPLWQAERPNGRPPRRRGVPCCRHIAAQGGEGLFVSEPPPAMRRILLSAARGAAAGILVSLACASAAAAQPDDMCAAATLHAKVSNAEVGVWLDRQTRHDGIEVVCRIRTVQFTRFLNVRAPEKDWWDRKAKEWSSINCANQMWRIAIADGWVILAKLTTASGEHADLIATCK